jgi:transglutaminase-like putative cysteine protease
MAPGQMSNLALSEEPAFRVRFFGRPPLPPQLYWRGPVLDAFDGLTWRRGDNAASGRNLRLSVGGPGLEYEVTLEPSRSRWVFALEMPGELPVVPGHELRISPQFELTADTPLASRVRYRASSHVEYALQRVLRQFREQPFEYTLAPPLLGRHTVDEFLYGTRSGFCEHYSGAFVFLMRAAGVPARVVTGYQGGELNPIDGFMTVRQSDAHAWAEVWIAGRGWLRVDPGRTGPRSGRRHSASTRYVA